MAPPIPACSACSIASVVSNFLRPYGTVACQAPLSMGFSRQECWSGLPCPSPRAQDTETQSSSLFEVLTLRESHGLGFSPASLRANPSPFAATLPFLLPSRNLTLQTLILLSFTEKQSEENFQKPPPNYSPSLVLWRFSLLSICPRDKPTPLLARVNLSTTFSGTHSSNSPLAPYIIINLSFSSTYCHQKRTYHSFSHKKGCLGLPWWLSG